LLVNHFDFGNVEVSESRILDNEGFVEGFANSDRFVEKHAGRKEVCTRIVIAVTSCDDEAGAHEEKRKPCPRDTVSEKHVAIPSLIG
jgi:hypothetical protein